MASVRDGRDGPLRMRWGKAVIQWTRNAGGARGGPIYGTVRYLSLTAARKKFDVEQVIERFGG